MITGVAFFNPTTDMLVTMPGPNRHSDIIAALYGETKKQVGSPWIQGFVNSDGDFLNRQEAAEYVRTVGQPLTKYAQEEYANRKLLTLFSEDLW
jgi:hypothetical protein